MTIPASSADARERRQRLAAALAASREEFIEGARAGRGGRKLQARYAARLDDIVRETAQAALPHTETPVAVVAIGGYGRRMQCLHSDVDLLVVVSGDIGRSEEQFINAFLQPLWDLGLTVGHHVRELPEIPDPDLQNVEFQLALQDARPIAGDAAVHRAVRAYIDGADEAQRGRLLHALLMLVRERHSGANDSLYQLEPDIKNVPGGLRDIGAIRLIRSLGRERVRGIDRGDDDRIAEAEEFLLRARAVLHVESGRDMNVLNHDLQERVAEIVDPVDGAPQQRVEACMGEYFRHARAVTRALEWSTSVVAPPPSVTHRTVGRHLAIDERGVWFAEPLFAASRPSLWLEAFRVAIANGCPVSEEARSLIQQNVRRYTPDDFVTTEGERLQILLLLKPRPGLYARLSEMNDCGLLGAIFPEFEKVHCRVVRDFHHKYTVDEHSLIAIRHIESLTGDGAPVTGFASILQEVHEPELLTLSLLFHDVGKWRDDEHVTESLRMAEPMLERLQLSEAQAGTVNFLIQKHLAMSQLAFRRDVNDASVVGQLAATVITEERLKLLCLLTYADVSAVSPGTLTPWKEELLWRLYVDTYNRLALQYPDDVIERVQAGVGAIIAGRPDDITEAELTHFLDGLPRRYLAVFGLAAIYSHVRLARGLLPDEVHASLSRRDALWELTVVTLDKPRLFSNIAGVLWYFGMNIHRGQAITTPDGLVLDVFEFSDAEGFLKKNARGTSDIYRMLDRVVAGADEVATLLRGRLESPIHRRRERFRPTVHLDNDQSQRHTVVEIVADDAPGLLYRISRAVSDEGCDVDLVIISTEGQRAIDVLHVTKARHKLEGESLQSLEDGMKRALTT